MSSFRKHFHNLGLQKPPNQQQPSASRSNQRSSFSVMKSNHVDSSSLLNESRTSSVAMNAASFKEDIFSCLEICSSYITALNDLCSTGAILAQNLTQVFSRDLVDINKSEAEHHAGKFKSFSKSHPFSFLANKSATTNITNTDHKLAAESDVDYTYYEVAEQFLQVWQSMSVSTAGASAAIKTETLMSLQEVINKLEMNDNVGMNNIDEPSLESCIQAAKCCLLSYIELQAQFSYKSWKSLNQLCKVLRSDSTMTDVVENIKQHFKTEPDTANKTIPVSLPEMKLPEAAQASNQDVYGLGDAINLLSLRTDNLKSIRKHKKRRKVKPRVNLSTMPVVAKSATFDGRYKLPESTAFGNETNAFGAIPNKVKQSTWPGKTRVSESTSVFNEWSLWSDNPISSTPLQRESQRDPFSSSNFQSPWKAAFSASDQTSTSTLGSCSVPHSVIGSLSGGSNVELDNRIVPSSTEGSSRVSESYASFLGHYSVKRNSSRSSEGLIVDPGFTIADFAFSDTQPGPGLDCNSRTAKTSTWPMKQGPVTGTSANGWATFSPMPSSLERQCEDAFAVSSSHSQSSVASSSLWPFQGPKTSQEFRPFESNNNSHLLNQNF
ncbi:hypothetical protein HDE_03231 [Halotydeus destructor]|nr:hypothetical protein HDE_03231 [Halotydeus destructor]